VATDERVRRVLEIKLQKVEYVGATHRVGEQRRRARADHVAAIETLMRRAQRAGQLARQPAARHQALGVDALLLGLIENWLMDPAAFDLVRVGDAAIDAHLRGLAPAGVPA
jgi:TetR/AcrR family acrAB operon transcriptional repressor